MTTKLFFVRVVRPCWLAVLALGCGGSGSNPVDAGPHQDSATSDAVKETDPEDTGRGVCTGLDAAAMMIMYTPACAACVQTKCCTQAQACAGDPACIAIVECQLSCIHSDTGLTPMQCAEYCVDDGGAVGRTAAQNFDFCLISSCPTTCTTR